MLLSKKNVEERSKFSDNLQYFRNQSCKSIQESTLKDLFSLVKSRTRRSFKRAYNLPKECRFHVNHNTILNRKIKKIINNNKAILRTHVRKYSILPHIFNKKIYVHNGSTFKIVRIKVKAILFRFQC